MCNNTVVVVVVAGVGTVSVVVVAVLGALFQPGVVAVPRRMPSLAGTSLP